MPDFVEIGFFDGKYYLSLIDHYIEFQPHKIATKLDCF